MDEPKTFGAPPKRDPKPGERFQLGIRVTPELKRRLDAAAEGSGRSQSQEAEIRLEKSFDREELLPEVLNIAYGKQVAGLLMLTGFLMNQVGDFVHFDDVTSVRGRDRSRVRRRHTAFGAPAEHWTSNSHAFDQAVEAAMAVLSAARVVGKPRGQLRKTSTGMPIGVLVANQMLELFLRRAPHGKSTNPFAVRARTIRAYLADITIQLPLFAKRTKHGSTQGKATAPPAVSEAQSATIADAILKLVNSRPRTPSREEIAQLMMSEIQSFAQKERKL